MFYRETNFQKTSIGRIPKDWEVVRLEDASLLITDGSHFSPEHQKNGYPLATVANMRENYIDIDSCYRISREDFERLANSRDKPEINDVLFSKDGTVGLCIVFNQKVDLIVLSSIAIIKPNMKKADPYFLKYMLQSRSVLNRIAGSKTGTAIRRIVLRDLSTVRLSLPKRIEEQKKIVGILRVVDSAILKVDEVIWKTERLKKGLMQQLLTRGIGHKEYKDTPIGKTPKTWQTVRLRDVSEDFIGGGTPSTSNPEYWNGAIAWMTSAHINGRLVTIGQKHITKKGLENSATNLVPRNNLLVATRVGIGKAAINKIDIAISQDLTGVIINKSKALPEFLYWVLINSGNRLKSLAQGSTIKGILREELGRLQIPLPSIAEQQKIDEILSIVDKKLELERKEKTRLERVKRGLMDLLLTGKVRVKVD